MGSMGLDQEDPIAQRAQELAGLQEEFPAFRIWQEDSPERVRLVAVRRRPGTSPHTVIAADVAELRAELTGSRPRQLDRGRDDE
jgi:hypothetical protein